MSSDRSSGAPSVANALSLLLDEVYGEMKPTDELKLVEKLQAEGHVVAMAGEGLVDAPAPAPRRRGQCDGHGRRRGDEQCKRILVKGDLRCIATVSALPVATVANMK